ncbi:hypothetical protein SSX86_019456 [Deinandra increscens subsp. villosa]|uniref:Protein CPR-5 n=1 Tax=Deinandra increscens subsp. villosa TaxID=3103831 RepID=A0AAP0CXH1_9ASTR
MEGQPPLLKQPPPPPPSIEADVGSPANPTSGDSNFTVDKHTKPNSTTIIKKKMKNLKKRKDPQKSHIDVPADPPQQSSNSVSSSSSSTANVSRFKAKGIRLSTNRRNPRVFSGPVSQRPTGGEADALALPLGMSIAAFVAQVLEKKDATGEKMSADHLSEICTLAVKESLSNVSIRTFSFTTVFGDKFDCFVSNFERSFQSTLMTLRAISESSGNRERSYLQRESSSNDFHFSMKENTSTSNLEEQATIVGLDEDTNEHRNGQNSQQLACVPPNGLHSRVGYNYTQSSALTTFERSVNEQARSNDLKALEISLSMQKMRLKEAQIAVDCDSNVLERFKLSMGISKANFRAEKFKTELEDSRHAQLLKKCVDCLVFGLLFMIGCLAYGIYIHSYQRLIEATESCTPTKKSSSWWIPKPMSSFSSGFQVLWCQVQAISQLSAGLVIFAITYLLIRRSGTTNQTMPVTFILLLLGVVCGFSGKIGIDTLGGSGFHWLLFWEIFCMVHLFANICTSMLFRILHGRVNVVDQSPRRLWFPYWLRRVVFYAALLVVLPVICGLMPFAGAGEWFEHFRSLVADRVSE